MFDSLQRAWVLSRRPPLDEVIREVARRSMTECRRRMSTAADTMSDAELRGYVRASAARPVRCEAEELATEQGWRIVLTDLDHRQRAGANGPPGRLSSAAAACVSHRRPPTPRLRVVA